MSIATRPRRFPLPRLAPMPALPAPLPPATIVTARVRGGKIVDLMIVDDDDSIDWDHIKWTGNVKTVDDATAAEVLAAARWREVQLRRLRRPQRCDVNRLSGDVLEILAMKASGLGVRSIAVITGIERAQIDRVIRWTFDCHGVRMQELIDLPDTSPQGVQAFLEAKAGVEPRQEPQSLQRDDAAALTPLVILALSHMATGDRVGKRLAEKVGVYRENLAQLKRWVRELFGVTIADLTALDDRTPQGIRKFLSDRQTIIHGFVESQRAGR